MRVRTFVVGVLGIAVIATGGLVAAALPPAAGSPAGASRLVSVQHLPLPDGDMCAWVLPDSSDADFPDQNDAVRAFQRGRPGAFLMAALQQGNLYAALQQARPASFVADGRTPIRKIAGPDTQLDNGTQRDGGGNVPAMRVDPIHNLLLIPTVGQRGSNGSGGRVLVFDRGVSGNVKPRAVITGPVRTGNQFEVYAPNRLMITHSRDALEIWRIPDRGESSEPPLRIPAPLGRASADTGIALDPAHKEVIIATAAGNTIMTFSVPEVFDEPSSSR
jgi:hypothetical protein